MKQASIHDFPNIEECKLFEGTKCDKCGACESEMKKWLISKGVRRMTDKRFKITSELPEGWVDIVDNDNGQTLCNIRTEYANYVVNLLNELDDDFNDAVSTLFKVQEENRNTKAVLEDFIKILNRLQADPNNEQTLNVARDMLQNMGVELK